MLRLAIVGIDGSGKSTSTLRVIQGLCPFRRVIKPGRPNLLGRGGTIRTILPSAGDFFESLFKKVDQTRKRLLIGQTRVLFIAYLSFVESWMVRRFRPEVVLSSRCPILDSAVYQEFYHPNLSRRWSLEERLDICFAVTGLPPRTGYFYLRTPVHTAMQRILKRIEGLYPVHLTTREHWLHLHENPQVLTLLTARLEEALLLLNRGRGSALLEIDTSWRDEIQVSEIVTENILKLPTDFRESPKLRI